MPKLFPKLVSAVIALSGPLALADTLPAGVRACAAQADALQRLECYDREAARYGASAPAPKGSAPPAAGVSNTPQNPSAAARAAPMPDVGAGPTSAQAPGAIATAPVTANAGPTQSAAASVPATKTSQHVAAKVLSIDSIPNEMVLHLDNGQVWQQQQGASGDLSLRAGDTVHIEKHLGTFYLTGPHVSGMKVRQIG